MTKQTKIELSIVIALLLACVVLNVAIRIKNNKTLGDFNSADEYLRTIDCAQFIDTDPLGQYVISFELRVDKPGVVEVSLYDPNGGRYWMHRQEINATTDFQHYEIATTFEFIEEKIPYSTLIFHGGYGTGVIPHVKNITVNEITE